MKKSAATLRPGAAPLAGRMLLLVSLCAALASCGHKPAGTPPVASPPFKVALLNPGPVSDKGWNALAYEGLALINQVMHVKVSQVQTHSESEIAENLRGYAASGYNLIIGHGYEYQEPALQIASQFPHSVFITSSGKTDPAHVRPNVAPLAPHLEEACYVLGMLAALISKTGKAGLVGGQKIPPVQSTFAAFIQGAHSVNPHFKVAQSYTNNWDDPGAAKEAALGLINQGADILFQNADAAGLGVFQAAKEKPGVYAFGSNNNQNSVAPKVVLASAVLELPTVFLDIAMQVRAGGFKGHVIPMSMKAGNVSVVFNPALASRIPKPVMARINAAEADIRSGKLKVARGV